MDSLNVVIAVIFAAVPLACAAGQFFGAMEKHFRYKERQRFGVPWMGVLIASLGASMALGSSPDLPKIPVLLSSGAMIAGCLVGHNLAVLSLRLHSAARS